MHYKIFASPVSMFIEIGFLGLVSGWHAAVAVTAFISEKDWGRLLGEDGFKAALLIGIVVVWTSSEKAKNQRHKELVTALENRDKQDAKRIQQFIDLSNEHIRSQGRVTNAIEAFDSNSQQVYIKLSEVSDKIQQLHNQPRTHG